LDVFLTRSATNLAPGIAGDSYAGDLGSPRRTEVLLSLAMDLGDTGRALSILRDLQSRATQDDPPWRAEYLSKTHGWQDWIEARA
jgi:hypothetical protein